MVWVVRGFDKGSIGLPKRSFWLYFHGGNTGSNPVGDAKSFQQLTVFHLPLYSHKKGTILVVNRESRYLKSQCFRTDRAVSSRHKLGTAQQTDFNPQLLWTPAKGE